MAWDGGPEGWRPPGEEKAAREATEKFERERGAADARTQAIAEAITGGFGIVADAILKAAGVPRDERAAFFHGATFDGDDYLEGDGDDRVSLADDVTRPADDDPDMDDLLAPNDNDG